MWFPLAQPQPSMEAASKIIRERLRSAHPAPQKRPQ